MTACQAKHSFPDIPDKDWLCPKCGADNGENNEEHMFVIEDSAEGSNDDCGLLHDKDSLSCTCGYGTTGKKFAALYKKKLENERNLITCPVCNGKGMICGKAKKTRR